MLSFEKCKELFDAGLRREGVGVGSLYFRHCDNLHVVVISVHPDLEALRLMSLRYDYNTSYSISLVEFSKEYIPVFTLEEILFAIREVSPVGVMVGAHVTIESACDMYLGIMKMSELEKPLEIKLGGIYRLRSGGAAMVYAIFKDGAYPVRAIRLEGGRNLSLCNKGFYINEEKLHAFDLVRLIGTVDQIEWEVGMPMWRRRSDGSLVRGVVNETYLELIKEDPYSYAPVYENGRFVRADVGEAELMRQAFMESMRKW